MMIITLSLSGLRPKNNNCRFGFVIYLQSILIIFQTIAVIKCSSYGHRISSLTPIKAAINSHHIVNHYEIDTPKEPYKPNLIEVKSSMPMFHIKFSSASSKVNVFHQHEPSKVNKEPIESFSQDEPHIIRQQVVKPIVQQIHEIITPVRKVVQEIKPVVETIDTIISRSTKKSNAINKPISMPPIPSRPPSIKSSSSPQLTQSSLKKSSPSIQQQDIVRKQKAFIGDLTSWLLQTKRKPDLLISKENELFDNSLYNGANEYDLKYPSHNSIDLPSSLKSNDYRLYED